MNNLKSKNVFKNFRKLSITTIWESHGTPPTSNITQVYETFSHQNKKRAGTEVKKFVR